MSKRSPRLAPLSLLLCGTLCLGVGLASAADKSDIEKAAASDPRSGAALNLEAAKQFRAAGGKAVYRPSPQFVLGGTVNDPAADSTAQDTQSETSVVFLGGGGRLVAAFNDSGSYLGGSSHFTGYAFSSDNGATWTDAGTLPASAGGDAGDPVLAHHQASDAVYLVTLEFSNLVNLQVFKSTDAGHTFASPVNGTPGVAGQQDKPWMTVDNFAGAGNGNVYLCWTRFNPTGDILFTRSTDGGASFGPSGGASISTGGQGCFVVVLPSHQVSVFYYRGTGTGGQGGDNKLFVRRSVDRGVTFLAEVQVADLATTSVNGNLALNGGLRSNSFPHAAVDPASGRLYVVYNDDPTPGDPADNGDIFVVRSNNGAGGWTAPVKVNNDDLARDQFFPTIAFNDAGGKAMVSWYSRSHDPSNSVFHRRGRLAPQVPGALVFNSSFQMSPDTPVAIGQDPVVNSTYMGDYDQIAGASSFYATWSDNRLGNAFHARQPDVRFARIAASPNAVDLDISVAASPASIGLGDETTITVQATANGGGASDVFVSMAQPPRLAIQSVTAPGGTCTVINGFISCSLTTISVGASKTIQIVATAVLKAGNRTVRAIGTTSSHDQTPANNTDTAVIAVASGSTVTQTFSTGNVAIPLPDLTTTEIPISIPVTGTLVQMIPQVRLDHTFDGDLDISLVSPGGIVVDLSSNNGGSGDNYGSGAATCAGTRTAFNDLVATSITAGTPPFNGSFKPEQQIVSVLGGTPNGTWKLRIRDEVGGDSGTLFCFRLVTVRKP